VNTHLGTWSKVFYPATFLVLGCRPNDSVLKGMSFNLSWVLVFVFVLLVSTSLVGRFDLSAKDRKTTLHGQALADQTNP
jgi:hypothetical protein